MADLPWENEERRNYICMQSIVMNSVSEGLRHVFKREWNSRYQTSLGAWDDTNTSGGQLYHREKTRKAPHMNAYLPQFQHGHTNQWNCSVLFDAILYSRSIGSSLNPGIHTEVNKLRKIRNRIAFCKKGMLTNSEFQTMASDVENSFKVLSLPIHDVIGIKSKRNLYKSFQVLPPKPTHHVVYRSEKINKMKQDLQKLRNDNDGKLTYFFIAGNPGSGKSQLSRQLGEELYHEIDWQENTAFVMTLNAENLDSLLRAYEDFCQRLNCDESIIASVVNSSKQKEEKIKKLRSQIGKRVGSWKLWWIIVDNVQDLNTIYPLLPQMGDKIWNNGQIMVTTQNTISVPSDSLDTKHISLSCGMNKKECRQLLSTLSDTDADNPLLDEVADKLDYQPLAMAAAAIYLQQLKETEFSWHDYLEKLEKGKRRVTEKRLQETNLAYSSTMSSAVLLALQKSAENSFILNETFKLFALISFEPLPIDIIIKYIQQRDQNCEKEEIYLAIKHCSLFLFTNNENDVQLHRVVHEATALVSETARVYDVAKALYCFKDRDDKIKIISHLRSFHAVNKSFFQQDLLDPIGSVLDSPESSKMYIFFGQTLRHNYQLKLALEFLNVSLQICKESELNQFEVFTELGQTHYQLGEFTKSKDYHQRALEIEINVLGAKHIDVATSYNNLGVVHKALGELEPAMDYHQQALEIQINVLGAKHIVVAGSYNNLGLVYKALGELEQAKEYHQRALEIQINMLGAKHIDVAGSYNNLGLVYKALGELEQAKDYHQRALEIQINVLGAKHVDVATSYNNLGVVHKALGELEPAMDYHQRALEIQINVLGAKHIVVAGSYNNLGLVYKALGELEQAKEYHQRALEIQINMLGAKHIDVAGSYNNLGLVYKALGELEQAKDYHQRALEIQINVLGAKHIDVATSYNNLGVVHKALGELEPAMDYHQQALEIQINVLGAKHIVVAGSCNNLGLVYKALGELEQAMEYHQRALEIQINMLGAKHIDVAGSYNNLGLVYKALGELEQAKDYHQRALEIQINVLGAKHIDVAGSYNNLGVVHKALGELEQAQEYHQRALEIQINVLGAKHIDVAGSYNKLGLVYDALGELEQAKDYYQRALEVWINVLGPNHFEVATSYNNLGLLYEALGELEQAKDYHQRALEIRKKVFGPNHFAVAASYDNLSLTYKAMGELEGAKFIINKH